MVNDDNKVCRPKACHPVAEMIKGRLRFISRKTSNQSYRPSMFAKVEHHFIDD